MHPGFTAAAYHNPDRLDPTQTRIPTKVPTNRVKGPCRSAEVAQLYPQVGDSITRR
jgi:hypothetical protein